MKNEKQEVFEVWEIKDDTTPSFCFIALEVLDSIEARKIHKQYGLKGKFLTGKQLVNMFVAQNVQSKELTLNIEDISLLNKRYNKKKIYYFYDSGPLEWPRLGLEKRIISVDKIENNTLKDGDVKTLRVVTESCFKKEMIVVALSKKEIKKYNTMTTEETVEALKHKQIPVGDECLIIAEKLEKLIQYRKYVDVMEQLDNYFQIGDKKMEANILVEYLNENSVIVKRPGLGNEIKSMTVNMSRNKFLVALSKWQNGMMIQEAFYGLPKEQREFILTGTTPEEWDEMFKDMDE